MGPLNLHHALAVFYPIMLLEFLQQPWLRIINFIINFTSATNLTTSVSDEQAIQKILDGFIAAWNAHDVKSFSELFAADLPSFLISSFARNVSTTGFYQIVNCLWLGIKSNKRPF